MYGISTDDVHAQAAFVEQHELNFPLLSDADGSAATKYGVLMPQALFAKRVTFVIDPKGNLRYIDSAVKVDSHGDDLVRIIGGLKEE